MKKIPNNIDGFIRYSKKPNTIVKPAYLYTKVFHFNTNNKYKDRTIRVYLPSTYEFNNPNKRFKVIYMFDGKNLFDDYTSFVGEWHVDETIERYIQEGKSEGIIVVGIDAPNDGHDRSMEMLPYDLRFIRDGEAFGKPYGKKLGKFVFETVKPVIDSTFYTLSDKDNTAIGGSSMGGLMAFYCGVEYRDLVGFTISFSPAFMCYKRSVFNNYVKDLLKDIDDLGKIYFFTGDQELDKIIAPGTLAVYRIMTRLGYNKNDVKLLYDSSKPHHESAWSEYFPDALKFWLLDK